jgi:hypothetical protein
MGIKGEFIGVTPDHLRRPQDSCRGDEINEWLSKNEVESFIILDDDTDMADLMHRLVHTDFPDGLQDEHIEIAINKLNGES